MSDSNPETQASVIITLTKEGNQNLEVVLKRLIEAGFDHAQTLDFGSMALLYGSTIDRSKLETVKGVKAVEVEGIKRTL